MTGHDALQLLQHQFNVTAVPASVCSRLTAPTEPQLGHRSGIAKTNPFGTRRLYRRKPASRSSERFRDGNTKWGAAVAAIVFVRCPSCLSEDLDHVAAYVDGCLIILRCRACGTDFAHVTEPRGQGERKTEPPDQDAPPERGER